MEMITHNLVGISIQILCFNYFLFPINIILTIIFAFASHFIVDAFAKITYHTPERLEGDKFWLIWHVIILILSFGSWIFFFIPFWLGMLFANGMDIWDWLIFRPIVKKRIKNEKEKTDKKEYFFHVGVDYLRKILLFWLPNWNYKRYAIIPELVVICGLLIFIITHLYF
ncbi:MAG: hypothetical protein ACTSW3_10395 [Promethearchaeota archaeon]